MTKVTLIKQTATQLAELQANIFAHIDEDHERAPIAKMVIREMIAELNLTVQNAPILSARVLPPKKEGGE